MKTEFDINIKLPIKKSFKVKVKIKSVTKYVPKIWIN